MQTLVQVLFLLTVLAFLSPLVQAALRERLHRQPKMLFVAPVLFTASFCLIVWHYDALSLPLILLVLGYTLLPAACAFLEGPGSGTPTWLDFAVILMLWLPLEFSVGQYWIPKHIQGFVHTVAYGIAITLALWVFLLFRGLQGMKYKLPNRASDLINPLIGFAAVAPVLIFVGLALSFIGPFHIPEHFSLAALATRFLLILAGVALPEEILFRALIQNWLMQKLGWNNGTLLLAAVIFGSAHLNNAPGPLPNWRYMLLATIAGIAYGKVFQKASSIFSSAVLHALVNTTRHAFF